MEYHGQRAPCFTTTHLVEENMHRDLRQLYDTIYRDFGQHIADRVEVA